MESPETHEMFPAERRARILEILGSQRAVRVSALSVDLGVSDMTIRRDLERLEEAGRLSRTHGGAILRRHLTEEPGYAANASSNAAAKDRIAQAAAAMIEPGETLFLGSGTTASLVLRHINPSLCARVITHNLGSITAAQGSSLDIVLLGGVYRARTNAVDGELPLELLATFRATRFILGSDGLSLEEGITTPSLGLAAVERAMIRQTRGDVVVLADSTKIGVAGDVLICPFETVQTVIVDEAVDDEVCGEMRRRGINVIVA